MYGQKKLSSVAEARLEMFLKKSTSLKSLVQKGWMAVLCLHVPQLFCRN